MRPVFLHLDEALVAQPGLLQAAGGMGARSLDARRLGPALRLWSRPQALTALREALRDALPAGAAPDLVFAGSGDFHHVTPMLIERAIKACGRKPVTVIHFDNHPDWVRFGNGLHCGSWVGAAARLTGVAKIITVGVCSRDIGRPLSREADVSLIDEGRLELFAYTDPDGGETVCLGDHEWPTIEAVGERPFSGLLLSRIATEAVYITIDKDVLHAADAATNWDQGKTSLPFLASMIALIGDHHRIIGADVLGDWSRPAYGGDLSSRILKRAEAMMDQPRAAPGKAALAVNERTNRVLLDLFATVAP